MANDYYIPEDRNDSGLDVPEYLDYLEQQDALPEHKRDGYMQRIYELKDMRRRELKENAE